MLSAAYNFVLELQNSILNSKILAHLTCARKSAMYRDNISIFEIDKIVMKLELGSQL